MTTSYNHQIVEHTYHIRTALERIADSLARIDQQLTDPILQPDPRPAPPTHPSVFGRSPAGQQDTPS